MTPPNTKAIACRFRYKPREYLLACIGELEIQLRLKAEENDRLRLQVDTLLKAEENADLRAQLDLHKRLVDAAELAAETMGRDPYVSVTDLAWRGAPRLSWWRKLAQATGFGW